MTGAAFFDLDRTVLRGASGPLINEALVTAGVVPASRLRGGGALYRFYELVGETVPSMALARAAAVVARGWDADAVREAGEMAAERLDEIVAPYARTVIAHHKDSGHPVVLATTTPHDLVAPLARRLGFDDVVATRYAEDDGGRYTGSLAGEFVWARGKLAAVRRWAEDNGCPLEDSYAYSDSVFDYPLLSAVGHAVAVNPDPRLLVVATVRRWPVLNLDVPPGVPKLAGVEPMDVVRWLTSPAFVPYARFDIAGKELIPSKGPAIVVANHRSYFDPVALGMTVLGAGRNLRFLGKKEVFDAPLVGTLARAAGGIRVERGTGSDEPLRQAADALAAGELVAILPQGTIPRGRAFFEPVLEGKTGAARLAAMTKVPVIPIGLWGTEKVWPRRSRVPYVHQVVNPPKVTVRVGPPVAGLTGDPHGDTRVILDAITALLPPEARRRRRPTKKEIELATPAGHEVPA
ncbi:MAG TPA: HAD-IB family hydrolase [Acidimicrobiales bacterium]|nr:HAD-IB family hydrolase [Acidimicrobiales bacterium]